MFFKSRTLCQLTAQVLCAGSDLVAASAAALAAASVAFETQDATYSAQLLATAESLYT